MPPVMESSDFTIRRKDFPALPGNVSSSDSSSESSWSEDSSDDTTGQSDTLRYNVTSTSLETNISADDQVSNISSGVICDHFGMLGLLTFIRALKEKPNLASLTLGEDLTTLGLNLESSDNLYSTFEGPWVGVKDQSGSYVPYKLTPRVRQRLTSVFMAKYDDDLLFYLFYTSPRNALQLVAAAELYKRGWRYHKKQTLWMRALPGVATLEESSGYSFGTYYVFDAISWKKVIKECFLDCVSGLPAETSLNTYIRDYAGLTGTKFMCKEGGCGACVVSLEFTHPTTGQERVVSINSCMFPVYSCHGFKVMTVEGIGSRTKGYHEVQSRLANFYGTQCGYCSPGWVMTMYSKLEANPKITMEEIEDSMGGNLCRCTGYRPILDAFKSFASDKSTELEKKITEIEDLLQVCPKSGICCQGKCKEEKSKRAPYDCVEVIKKDDCDFDMLEVAMAAPSLRLELDDGSSWYRVATVDEIFEIFSMITGTYMLVAGNTMSGVVKDAATPDVFIDVNGVSSLRGHAFRSNYLEVGANLSLTDAILLFNAVAEERPSDFYYLEGLAKHIDKVANIHVRNVGTIAGNLMIKHASQSFASDLFVMFEAVGALLAIRAADGSVSQITLEAFLAFDMDKKVLLHIILPVLNVSHHVVKTYKIAPRAQNSSAYVNAGFKFKVDKKDNYRVLAQPSIVIGKVTAAFVHATNTEQYLVGKKLLDVEVVQKALSIMGEEIQPDHTLPDPVPEFRLKLAQALFYRVILGLSPKNVNTKYQSGAENLSRPLSSGKQDYEVDSTTRVPLYNPYPKMDAILQCSGEAEYVWDLPKVGGELYAAFVFCKHGPATLESLDASQALATLGVKAFYSAADIPGTNTFTPAHGLIVENEKLFADTEIQFAGQVVGIVVAETQHLADKAAELVVINLKDKRTPSTDVTTCVKNNETARFTLEKEKAGVTPKPTVAKVVKGEFSAGSQYHYPMETMVCVCNPTEDGGLDVFCASQWLQLVQETIAVVVNLKQHKVNVKMRRVGGSYGLKLSRANQVAGACGLASYLQQRPVRMIVKMETMMEAIGKRWPVYFNYEAGVDDNGVIQYCDTNVYSDAGAALNDSVITLFLYPSFTNIYKPDTWGCKMYDVKTDKPTTCWTRSPGTLEGLTVAEQILEHIAHEIGQDPLDVKLKNAISTDNTEAIVKSIIEKSDFTTRKTAVEDFNNRNVWKKRGISLVPMKFPFETLVNYHATVSVYRNDGSVSITHGGIEIGQGINVKAAQTCASAFGISLDMVTVKDTDMLSSPNSGPTGGSCASESVCYAVDKCCAELISRMQATKDKLTNPTWPELVQAAYANGVNFVASYMFSPAADFKQYDIYGATVCEVEVDILTGEHRMVRVDILEDAGKSLNPFVDIGQIEGAFMMGVGYFTMENLVHDPASGRMLTNRSLKYVIPGAKDIPTDFRVYIQKNTENPLGILGSKGIGEPPLCMSASILFAIRQALRSARKDMGLADEWFEMNAPFTGVNILLTSGIDVTKFLL